MVGYTINEKAQEKTNHLRKTVQQLIAYLTDDGLSHCISVGVDYFGPLEVKQKSAVKRSGCIFYLLGG